MLTHAKRERPRTEADTIAAVEYPAVFSSLSSTEADYSP